jgi:hypothetical protein
MDRLQVEGLLEALRRLGFGENIEGEFVRRASFCLPHFSIRTYLEKGNDSLRFELWFQRKIDIDGYECLNYDAVLRKHTPVPDLELGGIELKVLVQQMNLIPWKEIFENKNSDAFNGAPSWEIYENIEKILLDLKQLEGFPEGIEVAQRLKVFYWADISALDSFWNASIKSRYEICQRFYLQCNQGITAEEAYRFLLNRWLEKEQSSKKKIRELPEEIKGQPAGERKTLSSNVHKKRGGRKPKS